MTSILPGKVLQFFWHPWLKLHYHILPSKHPSPCQRPPTLFDDRIVHMYALCIEMACSCTPVFNLWMSWALTWENIVHVPPLIGCWVPDFLVLLSLLCLLLFLKFYLITFSLALLRSKLDPLSRGPKKTHQGVVTSENLTKTLMYVYMSLLDHPEGTVPLPPPFDTRMRPR